MDNATIISGYSVCLPFAKDSDRLIDNIKQGKRVNKAHWFDTDEAAKVYGLKNNAFAAKLVHEYDSIFNLVCDLIVRSLEKAMLDQHCLSGDNVRVYFTGLGARVDVADYASFYDHNDIEDVKLTKSIQNLHISKVSQDKLAYNIAKKYRLKFMPPNMHCTSNSSLSAVHLGIQAIGSGTIDLVMVINCSEIKTQDIYFLESQSMLEGELIQPFGEESNCVLPSEGFSTLLLESARHRNARQAPGGIKLTSTYTQTSTGRSNDPTQFASNLVKVMSNVMEQANVTCEDLCAIIPHANCSEASDKAESQALRSLLGDSSVPILAYKGQIGYVATGSGIVDLIIGHYSLRHGELFSPVGEGAIRENIAQHVLMNDGVIKHNKKHLLKLGLGVDGSIIGIIMSDNDYTPHTSSCLGVGCVTRPILGLAPSGPLQAAFKSAKQICHSPQEPS
ncbi:beta-ketoacyl synthase N-terminal-like domain-containing protein [Serratia sp. Ag2]|uniref:beta-ketoacyl synthase N-terminal-like domain-containing protein n=1 Tax=Serratia sp. Ag2 TaxID=1532556 RepID=UPI0009077650|nr:beta-ketoacyl synthase N-terminal-like domain-containing protein [Serratia sp. Ag2]